MNSHNDWIDPLYLHDLLSEEEKAIKKTAEYFCKEKLLSRVIEENKKLQN